MSSAPKNNTHYTFDKPFVGGKDILIPKSLGYLARLSFKHFKAKKLNLATEANKTQSIHSFEKAESLLESWLSRETRNEQTQQQPTHALCAFLTPKPIWEAEDSPLLAHIQSLLRENTALIANEFSQALESAEASAHQKNLIKNINTGKGFLEKDTWRNVQLGSLGNYSTKIKTLFPNTIALLEPLGQRIFSAEFIVMEADTKLPPHTDATNAYLVAHLGLIVPDNCGLQVKDKLCDFHQGEVIFFDQSFVHSAWNKGESRRVNLLLTIFHPELNDTEVRLLIDFISFLQKRAFIFSPIILSEYAVLKFFALFK